MRRLPPKSWCRKAIAGIALIIVWCVTAHPAGAAVPAWIDGQLLVRPKASARSVARAAVAAEGAFTGGEIAALGVEVVQAPSGRGTAVERALRASGLFRYVERNYVATVSSVPNDPLYVQQWGLPVVGAPEVWPVTRGAGVTIAVVDTGVDATHPDLAGRLVTGFNAIDGSSDSTDDNGHGTRMAGIASAVGFNGVGVVGVAPEAAVMPVKSLGATGSGTYADIARGIVYAVDHGARVINLSLGGQVSSSTLSDAVAYAIERGVVLVAAAGNFGVQAPSYPAAYTDVIAVGATDEQDVRAAFSSYGAWLDLVAPGVDILTTNLGGGYADSSGTSPAAPFVSAAAALVLAINPALQPHQVASVLALTDDDLGTPGFDPLYGWGRLNIARAVSQAAALAATPDSGAPTVRLVDPPDGSTLKGIISLVADANDDVGVARVEYAADGVVVASSSQPPFTATWDTEFTLAGPHLLSATAYDASGNRGVSTPVTVSVDGTPVSCSSASGRCLPGGGKPGTDCFAEWFVPAGDVLSAAKKAPVVRCTDGAACDQDGKADGVCTFAVGLCFSVTEPASQSASGSQLCDPGDLTRFQLLAPSAGGRHDATDFANAVALVTSVAALGAVAAEGTCVAGTRGVACGGDADCDSLPGSSDGVCALRETSLAGVVGGSERCTALQVLRVPLNLRRSRYHRARRAFKIATFSAVNGRRRPLKDTDSLRLICQPAS